MQRSVFWINIAWTVEDFPRVIAGPIARQGRIRWKLEQLGLQEAWLYEKDQDTARENAVRDLDSIFYFYIF